jgi:hypothetical protein
MRDELDLGMRYAFTASAASEAGRLLVQPAAAAMPSWGSDTGLGQSSSVPVVDWQGSASGGWGMQLSPFAAPAQQLAEAPNLAEFVTKPLTAGFDGLGRALLGKGKVDR